MIQSSPDFSGLIQTFESLSGIELGRFCLAHSDELCNSDFVRYFDSVRHSLDDIHLSEGLNILCNINSDEANLIASEYLSHPTTFVRMSVIMRIRAEAVTSEIMIKRIVSAILTLYEYKNTVYMVSVSENKGLFPSGSAFGLQDLYLLLKESLSLETENVIRPLLPALAGKLGREVYNDFPVSQTSP